MASLEHRKDGAIRIIQLTDPHIGPNPEYRLASTRTCDSLRRVLTQLASMDLNTDKLVVTGDIVGKGLVDAYRLFEREISSLHIPYHWLPGNHDDPRLMATMSVPFQREVKSGRWLLLLLNSASPGQVGGHLAESELLAACAAARGHDGPVSVFVHHPPVSVGSEWLDKQSIENGEEMLSQLAACGNVRAVFAGHVHQAFHAYTHGMDVYTTPSTCFQFESGSNEFALSSDGPGCRWIDFYDDGTFETGVIQLEPTADQLDHQNAGY